MEQIDVSALSFEDALERLEKLVETIDSGNLPLAEAIDAFRLATALRERCAALLQEAEIAIEELVAEDTAPISVASDDEPDEGAESSPFAAFDDDESEEPFGNPFGD